MKNLISLIVLVFAVHSLHAQTETVKGHELLINNFKLEVNEYQRMENRFKNLEGDPYYTDNFQKGKIHIQGNKSFTDVELNYNMYSDEFEFVSKGGKIFVLSNLDEVEKVVYNNKTFKHDYYSFGVGKPQKGYLMVLVEGNCSLYKKLESEFKDAEEPETGYDQYKPPRFVDKSPKYFIECKGEDVAQIISSLRRKKFLQEHFKEDRKKLLKWMRENNINLHDEEEKKKYLRHIKQ